MTIAAGLYQGIHGMPFHCTKNCEGGICELSISPFPNNFFSLILLILEKLRIIFFPGSSMITSYSFEFPRFFVALFLICFKLFFFFFLLSSGNLGSGILFGLL